MVDYEFLLDYLQKEIKRLEGIMTTHQKRIADHEEGVAKHKQILEGENRYLVVNKWQYGNGIENHKEAILNLQIMLATIGKKTEKLIECEQELRKLVA